MQFVAATCATWTICDYDLLRERPHQRFSQLDPESVDQFPDLLRMRKPANINVALAGCGTRNSNRSNAEQTLERSLLDHEHSNVGMPHIFDVTRQ